jgi:predicted O-methyltransferase YrrM
MSFQFPAHCEFTEDWTSSRIAEWEPHLVPLFADKLNAKKPLKIMEIGTFQGRTAVYFLERWCKSPGSHFTSVDPYFYGRRHEMTSERLQHAKKLAEANLAPYGDLVTRILKPSTEVLPTMELGSFDLIYVDGEHKALSCLLDMGLCWFLVAPGGVMITDDMNWKNKTWDRPGVGAKAFLDCVRDFKILWNKSTLGLLKHPVTPAL